MLGPTISCQAVRQEPIFPTIDPLEGSVMDLTVLIFLVSILAQAKFMLKSIVLDIKQDKMFQTE